MDKPRGYSSEKPPDHCMGHLTDVEQSSVITASTSQGAVGCDENNERINLTHHSEKVCPIHQPVHGDGQSSLLAVSQGDSRAFVTEAINHGNQRQNMVNHDWNSTIPGIPYAAESLSFVADSAEPGNACCSYYSAIRSMHAASVTSVTSPNSLTRSPRKTFNTLVEMCTVIPGTNYYEEQMSICHTPSVLSIKNTECQADCLDCCPNDGLDDSSRDGTDTGQNGILNDGLDDNTYEEGIHWKRNKVLGSGSFSTCYAATDCRSDKKLCVKQFNGQEKRVQNEAMAEIQMLAKLKHKNILRPFINKLTVASTYCCIFTEYMPGGSIEQLLKANILEPQQVQEFIKQLLAGMVYLQYRGIVHRDLKGGNLLLDERCKWLKIGDFGLAVELSRGINGDFLQRKDRGIQGTPRYMSPERARQEHYDQSSDMWSVGLVIAEMLTRKVPFDSIRDNYSVIYKIGIMKEPPKLPPTKDIKLMHLMSSCLQIEKQDRSSTVELLQCHFVNLDEAGISLRGPDSQVLEMSNETLEQSYAVATLSGDDLYPDENERQVLLPSNSQKCFDTRMVEQRNDGDISEMETDDALTTPVQASGIHDADEVLPVQSEAGDLQPPTFAFGVEAFLPRDQNRDVLAVQPKDPHNSDDELVV